MYIVCEEAGKRYVAEMYISNSAPNVRLALNQYFTTLDDVNRVIPFGKLKDQLLLIGDEEFMMTTFAVNRHVLLDLGLPQPRTKYESFASEYVW